MWAQLGRCRLQAEHHTLAVPPLQRAALLQPRDEQNLWLLIQAAAAAGRKPDAVEAIEQLTALLESHIDAPGAGRALDARLQVGPGCPFLSACLLTHAACAGSADVTAGTGTP